MVEKIKDIHKGKPALICGAGSSLNFLTKSVAKKYVTFCVNSAIYKLEEWDYMVVTDGTVPLTKWHKEIGRVNQVISASYDTHDYYPDAIKLERKYHDYMDGKFEYPLIMGTDAVQVSANIAYLMGCSPIILIGVDLRYHKGKKYYNQKGTAEEWRVDNDVPINYDWQTEGSLDVHLKNSYSSWERIKEANPDIDIRDASMGRLTFFKPFNLYVQPE